MGELAAYLRERARSIADDPALGWEALDGSSVLVTGATGLIGAQLVRTLLARPAISRVVLPVRNVERAQARFGSDPRLSFMPWEAGQPLLAAEPVDYVVHGAAPTSSAGFAQEPVEVIGAVVCGTRAVLEMCRVAKPKKMVFLSTMEVYGEAFCRLDETTFGPLDPMVVRSSYPESKRLAECLVAAYASEYGVRGCTLRLAQTFGEGVARDDGRVFADFGRHAIAGEDVTLLTTGTKKNPYLSVDDAVRAILVALARGEAGLAYNAANEATYVAIRDLARAALDALSPEGSGAEVVFSLDADAAARFRAPSELDLDTTRLQALGWRPTEGFPEMFGAMAHGWTLGDE